MLFGCQSNSVVNPVPSTLQPHEELEKKVTVQIVQPAAAPTNTPTPIPSPTPVPVKTVYIDPNLPADITEGLTSQLQMLASKATSASPRLQLTQDSSADIVIDARPTQEQQATLSLITYTLAVVAPFPTIADTVTLDSLIAFWRGDVDALTYITNNGVKPKLFLDVRTRAMLLSILGEPSPTTALQVVSATDIVSTTWAQRPGAIAIVPFDELEARWKQLWLNGLNLFDKSLTNSAYPLTFVVNAHFRAREDVALLAGIAPTTNRDVSQIAIIAMTGVTALVRGTAVMMESKGITYPGQMIRDWLVTADIAHISNEVSFWDQCPAPSFNDGVSMCSRPKYIELLKYVGTDVIELSGNHLWDKGANHLDTTLDMYDQLGWPYFAGGRTYTESQRPLTMTVAGNKIAFVGCNYFGADWATPRNELPGSALCGADNPSDFDLITPTIQSLSAQGYLVIATIQYAEFYFYEPTLQQAKDFKALRDAGAVVVNGSQGHHAQGFDVSASGFIHYGTGNLFFGDQAGAGTHQSFVDRHAFYKGKYLGVDLRTAFIEDYSQPVPMKPTDRAELLRKLFDATGY